MWILQIKDSCALSPVHTSCEANVLWIWRHNPPFAAIFASELFKGELLRIIRCKFCDVNKHLYRIRIRRKYEPGFSRINQSNPLRILNRSNPIGPIYAGARWKYDGEVATHKSLPGTMWHRLDFNSLHQPRRTPHRFVIRRSNSLMT